jgi:branched-chain amino acid transport system ATP-binding protein
MSTTRQPRLEAHDLGVHFDGLKALDGIDLWIDGGEIVGLIGPNGAGKTTLLNVLSGFQAPTSGRVVLDGADVTGWPAERLARRRLVRTFQSVRLFPALTLLENVQLGGVGVGMSRRRAERQAVELLGAVGLAHRAGAVASALPHGEERLAGVARALAVKPRFLLLDEPGAGLNEDESDELLAALREIHRRFDVSIVVVEHDMRLIMRLCGRLHVLDHGRTLAVGTPDEVRRDPAVLDAYLGTGHGHVAA